MIKSIKKNILGKKPKKKTKGRYISNNRKVELMELVNNIF